MTIIIIIKSRSRENKGNDTITSTNVTTPQKLRQQITFENSIHANASRYNSNSLIHHVVVSLSCVFYTARYIPLTVARFLDYYVTQDETANYST